jgi:hypothetical protein
MIQTELLNEVRNLPIGDRITLMESILSSIRDGFDISPDRGKKNIRSVKKRLLSLFREYKGVKPYENIDPLQWEREIRNEW